MLGGQRRPPWGGDTSATNEGAAIWILHTPGCLSVSLVCCGLLRRVTSPSCSAVTVCFSWHFLPFTRRYSGPRFACHSLTTGCYSAVVTLPFADITPRAWTQRVWCFFSHGPNFLLARNAGSAFVQFSLTVVRSRVWLWGNNLSLLTLMGIYSIGIYW